MSLAASPSGAARADGLARRPTVTRLLIIGGTAEARALAEACAPRPELSVITSLAGRTRAPQDLPGEVRVGGFGGADGLARFLRARTIDRVIDASHPFAEQIGRHAAAACEAAGIPRLRLLRPPWRRRPGDRWIEVADLTEAARRLPELGRRAFLSVGHKDLAAFAGLSDVWLLIRTIEPPKPLPLDQALWLQGRGPFSVDAELALLCAHGIDVLVTKASGGDATYAKLAAARALGLPMLMLRRPPPPPGPLVRTVAAALAWLDRG
jgi:precorrin-6A/cobalt-precorrin-6A reductase